MAISYESIETNRANPAIGWNCGDDIAQAVAHICESRFNATLHIDSFWRIEIEQQSGKGAIVVTVYFESGEYNQTYFDSVNDVSAARIRGLLN